MVKLEIKTGGGFGIVRRINIREEHFFMYLVPVLCVLGLQVSKATITSLLFP